MNGLRVRYALLGLMAAFPSQAAGQPPDSVWLAERGFHTRAASQPALVHRDTEGLRELRGARVTQMIAASHDRLEVRSSAARRTVIVLHADEDWRRTGDPGCELAIILNGRRVREAGVRAASIDNIMRRTDLVGLEIYDAESSPAGETDCGAVLLWAWSLRGDVDDEFSGQLRGRVLRQPGDRPLPGVAVVVEPGGLAQETDSSGRFDFGGLPAAIYHLTATTESGATWSTRIFLRAYAIADIVIEVEGGPAGATPPPPLASPPGPTPVHAQPRSARR